MPKQGLCLVLGTLLLHAGAGAAAPLESLAGGQTGTIEFVSRTPSGPSELVAGSGAPTVISGRLTVPAGGVAPLPAMVIAHGSGGIRDDRELAWAERLNGLGVATFIVDSFTPRGIQSTGADQSRLRTVANVADAFYALRLLATHPRIDPARIGVMGFSRGGQVALYTALEPFRHGLLGDGVRFALHIALYASCSLPYKAQAVTGAPIVFLLGEADDYTPAGHCDRYVAWFQEKGAPVRSVAFKAAHHGFDSTAPEAYLSRAQTARSCGLDIAIDPVEGRRWDSSEIVPADRISAYLRGCMQRGATFGGNDAARAGAIKEVELAVRSHLLKP